jgi:ubiquinone/menaquinone biosynthesis C-methylase UbiE
MSKLSQLLRSGRRAGGAADYAHAPSRFEVSGSLSPTVGTAAELYRKREQVEGVGPQFAALLEEPATIAAIERDPVPVPAADDREGYCGERHLTYWLSGLSDLRMVKRLLPSASFYHVLDFGGATGRFARHVVLADSAARVTIADLNVNHIEWVEQHFGPSVRGVKVSPYPHFPLADQSVTLCVGLSVFTHTDAYETGWLAEIERVLVHGGYALLTIHSEQTWPILSGHAHFFKTLNMDPDFRAAFRLGQPMPEGRRVYTFKKDSIEHNCNVFMDANYVRRRWGRRFEVMDVVHRAHHDFQAAVLLRKRD